MMGGRGAAIGWMMGHHIRNVDDAEAAWGHSSLFSGWRPQWVLHLLEVLPSLVGLCAQTNHSFWVWLSSLGVVCGRRNTSQSDQTGNYCLLSLPELHAVTLLGCRTTHGSRFWMCLGWKLADPAPIDSFTVVACGRKDPGRAMQEPTCRKDIPSQRENQRDQGALGSISGGTPRRYAENELQTVR